MPLIPLLTTWLIGWLVLALQHRPRLGPAAIGTAWLLGTGVVYLAHYGTMLLFQVNPPPVLLFAGAAGGVVMLLVKRPTVDKPAWQTLRREPLAALLLVGGVGAVTLVALLNGFGHDGQLIWLGRAIAYHQIPDYAFHLARPFPLHPDYPPLFIHQYQWQFNFTESVAGLKLPGLAFYLTTLLFIFSLLRGSIQSPVKWTLLAALLPIYWNQTPMAQADIPLGAFIIGSVYWLHSYLRTRQAADWRVGFGLAAFIPAVKFEGLVVIACLVLVLLGMMWRWHDARPYLRRVFISVIIAAGFTALMWYGITLSVGAPAGDFSLSHPRPGEFVSALVGLPLMLLSPYGFHAIWYVFVAAIIWRRPRIDATTLFWLLPLLYAGAMLAAYLFSNWIDLTHHMRTSYYRLLLQMTPLVMVWLGWTLADPVSTLTPDEATADQK